MTKRLILFFAVSLSALCLGFFLPHQWLSPAFHYSGYYFMLLAFILWGALILDVLKNDFLRRAKAHSPALLFAIVLMALIFQISPPKFKILADETNLISVSMAMHQNRTVSKPYQGLSVAYSPFDYDKVVDPRPLFYPFVISLLHALIGYSPFNGMVVNFFSAIGILFLLYLLISQIFSKFFGIVAMIIMASFPVFIFWSTSSGFETINLLFIIVVLLSLFLFLKHQDVKYAEITIFSLVLLANCRYESVLFFFSLLILAPHFLNKNIITTYRFPTFFMPLLFLPIAWQRRIIFQNTSVLANSGPENPEHIFGVANLLNNFSPNIFTLTGLKTDFGFLFLIFIAAVAGMYLAGKKLFLNNDIYPENKALGYYLLTSGVLLFVLYSSFFWGRFTLSIDNRLSVALLPFIIIPAVYCIYRLFHNKSQLTKITLVFLLLMQMLYYRPVAAELNILKSNVAFELNVKATQYLYQNHDIKNKKILLITDAPFLFIIHGIGAIDFNKALHDQKKLHYLHHVYYDQILVFQRCDPITDRVLAPSRLDETFHLHKLKKIKIASQYYLLISEVVSCKPQHSQ